MLSFPPFYLFPENVTHSENIMMKQKNTSLFLTCGVVVDRDLHMYSCLSDITFSLSFHHFRVFEENYDMTGATVDDFLSFFLLCEDYSFISFIINA